MSVITNVIEKLRGWQERHRVLNELYAMDDRALADIGLHRSEIPFVVVSGDAMHSAPVREAANADANVKHAA